MAKSKQEIYKNRPTSPHLTIYRKQISSVLSIFHRLSGVGLFCGLSVVSWWFILWVFSKFDPYFLHLGQCKIFKLALVLISYAGFFHLCTGIRHLVWDSGHGFSIKAINTTGWLAVGGSILMTIIFWLWVI